MTSPIETYQFNIKSDPKNLQPFLKESLAPLLTKTGFSGKTLDNILVAIGEGVTNCMRHSYEGQMDQPIEILVEDMRGQVTFHIRDYGLPVDLEKVKLKSTPTLPPVTPGGLGIYFMKTIMDEMGYNTSHAKGNELILVKKKQGVAE